MYPIRMFLKMTTVLRFISNFTHFILLGFFSPNACRQTLWKRVQSAVIPFLAYMVSVIDRDCNMNLLDSSGTEDCVKGLWMFIFNDLTLLNIPYVVGQNR